MEEKKQPSALALGLLAGLVLVTGIVVFPKARRTSSLLFPSKREAPALDMPASPSPGPLRGSFPEALRPARATHPLQEDGPPPHDPDWSEPDEGAYGARSAREPLLRSAAGARAAMTAGGAGSAASAGRSAPLQTASARPLPSAGNPAAGRPVKAGMKHSVPPVSGRAIPRPERTSRSAAGRSGSALDPVPTGTEPPASGAGRTASGATSPFAPIPVPPGGRVLTGGGPQGIKLQLGPEAQTPLRLEPPPGFLLPMPNMAQIVSALASQYPAKFAKSCGPEPGAWEFLDLVVDTLRRTDARWGYNCKRGNCGDPSKDVIAYYAGQGRPYQGAPQVRLADIIVDCGGPGMRPGWSELPYSATGVGWTSRGRF